MQKLLPLEEMNLPSKMNFRNVVAIETPENRSYGYRVFLFSIDKTNALGMEEKLPVYLIETPDWMSDRDWNHRELAKYNNKKGIYLFEAIFKFLYLTGKNNCDARLALYNQREKQCYFVKLGELIAIFKRDGMMFKYRDEVVVGFPKDLFTTDVP